MVALKYRHYDSVMEFPNNFLEWKGKKSMAFYDDKTFRISVLMLSTLSLAPAYSVTSFAQTSGTVEGARDTGATSIEAERGEAAQQARQSERAKAAEAERVDRPDYRYHRSGELYVAGFGGYTFGHSFNNAQGSGAFSGLTASGIDLKTQASAFMERRSAKSRI
jgi:hypothetical protein